MFSPLNPKYIVPPGIAAGAEAAKRAANGKPG
jgi:hypothetical protein